MLSKAKSRYLSGKKTICLILFLLVISSVAYTQSIELEVLFVGEYEIFYPSSLDKNNPPNQPLLFVMQVTNNDMINSQSCKLSLSFSSSSPDFPNILTRDQGIITHDYTMLGSTNPDSLVLGPGQSVTFSNRDLIRSEMKIEGNWNDILNAPENQDFKDLVLGDGFLPAYTYIFTLYAVDPNVTDDINDEDIYDSVIATVNITNPSSVELITPGESFSNSPPLIVGNSPIFGWFSPGSEFRFEIYEILPGETAEDVVNKTPHHAQDGITDYIYPYSGSYPALQPGQPYGWRVIRTVYTTLGEIYLTSELFCFIIELAPGTNTQTQNIITFIQNLQNFGINIPGLNTGQFSPTGGIYLNGVLISPEDLLNLLNAILGGDVTIVIE